MLVFFYRSIALIVSLAMFLAISGCSVYMAAKQPNAKKISLFQSGTPRNLLLGEFGPPIVSEDRDGKTIEIFKFTQGYSTGVKTGRVIFHSVADVVTLGLWEVVGMPTETVFSGSEMAFQVSYDDDNNVDEVIILKKK
ncbi:MAG: hypothetical protein KF908_04510 [Nitrosomonas sp.]|nr:hypothetical protein [Nitrosomonas sp.]MCW5608241.1 hypothetical protein [Nitrosomonas sp.]